MFALRYTLFAIENRRTEYRPPIAENRKPPPACLAVSVAKAGPLITDAPNTEYRKPVYKISVP